MSIAEKAVLTSVPTPPLPSIHEVQPQPAPHNKPQCDQQQQGLILVSDVRQASAANYKAKADLLQANLAYLLAWTELQRTVGRTPGAQGK
jgi:hypothetical protein